MKQWKNDNISYRFNLFTPHAELGIIDPRVTLEDFLIII